MFLLLPPALVGLEHHAPLGAGHLRGAQFLLDLGALAGGAVLEHLRHVHEEALDAPALVVKEQIRAPHAHRLGHAARGGGRVRVVNGELGQVLERRRDTFGWVDVNDCSEESIEHIQLLPCARQPLQQVGARARPRARGPVDAVAVCARVVRPRYADGLAARAEPLQVVHAQLVFVPLAAHEQRFTLEHNERKLRLVFIGDGELRRGRACAEF